MCVLLGSHLLWGWGAQNTQTSKIDPHWDGDKSTSFLFQFSCIDRGQQRMSNVMTKYTSRWEQICDIWIQMFWSFYSAISKWIGSSGSLGSNASKDVESSKFSFSLLSFSPGVTYGGKMIEFLCKVEFPASPRTSRVPVRQNQVWQNVPLESPFEKYFKYSSTSLWRVSLWEYFKYATKVVALLSGLILPPNVYKLLKWDLKANLFMHPAKSKGAYQSSRDPLKTRRGENIFNFRFRGGV